MYQLSCMQRLKFYNFCCVYSSGAGNHYGTFSGTIGAFSPVMKGKKAAESPGKNFLTNPPKKGTGFGYLNVTIGAPPKYMSDAYERARELRKVIYNNIVKLLHLVG